MVTRGGVYVLEHQDWGRRPVLVLTRQAAIPVLKRVTVATISRRIRGIPTEVVLDEQDGMSTRCAVSLDNLGEAWKALLTEQLTTLDESRMGEVCHALDIALGC
ncbi:MAG: type II toxin-antitoxin system PemK/MazF family toxin [Acidimicrobiia bacterium]|nr:type II toxin-antitoxin system PemK/MazF family toxin [Acidimicrobiia bacterium]